MTDHPSNEPSEPRAARVAIVTGASSGIGQSLAERAVRAGWNVVAVGRRAERLDALAERVATATGRIAVLALDLRVANAPQTIVTAALERFGRIDVLVNNAGGVAVGPIAEQTDAALREQVETHVVVPLALTREALSALRASRGHVFFVGSGVARIPVGTLGAYPPAKAAVRNMARVARNELRPDGIAVTYVDPGAVATEFMTRAGFSGPPRGLAASPHDVARKLFAAFETRPNVVNAVPWQTFFVALGEALPGVTDFILSHAPQIVGGERSDAPPAEAAFAAGERSETPQNATVPNDSLADPFEAARDPFEAALEPLENRMQRLKLRPGFVAELLQPGAVLDLDEVAMRWAGMPNKNERGITRDVFVALAQAGFVEALDGDDAFRVVRGASIERS